MALYLPDGVSVAQSHWECSSTARPQIYRTSTVSLTRSSRGMIATVTSYLMVPLLRLEVLARRKVSNLGLLIGYVYTLIATRCDDKMSSSFIDNYAVYVTRTSLPLPLCIRRGS